MKQILKLQLFADGSPEDGGDTGEITVDAGQESASEDTVSRQEEYRRVRQDFKKEFDEEVGRIVKGRLKKTGRENQQLNERVSALNPVIKALSERYSIADDDIEALARAVTDESVQTPEASEDDFGEIYAGWSRQSEQTSQMYPEFDFDTEMEGNDKFRSLVCRGIDVTDAYELAHKDEIIMNAMEYALKTSERKIASSVAANMGRERENGLSAGNAAAVRVDIASLTNEQLDGYLARARQGEKIDFITRF